MKSLWKIRAYLKPHWAWILVSVLLSIPMAAIKSSPIVLIQKLVDTVLKAKDERDIERFAMLVIGVYAANFVVRFAHYAAIRVVVARVNRNIKNDLYDHVMGLSADYFTTASTGSLISRVGSDPNQIDQGIAQINVITREPLILLFAIGYAFFKNWQLALVVLAIFPPLALVFSWSGKALKRLIHKIQEEQGFLFGTLQESFSGFRIIKAFRLEGYMQRKFHERSYGYYRNLSKTIVVEELSHPAVDFLSAFAVAMLIYVGGKSVLRGTMTQGELVGFFAAFAMMQNPIRDLNEMSLKLGSASGAIDRVLEIFSWKSRLNDKAGAEPKTEFQSRIELDHVRFAYPDAPEREILKGVSIEIPKGRSVALVGASGAGKSSLVSLLPRIFDVTSGSIRIDGRDIRDIRISDLRSLISVVSQDVFLFNDTIEENVRCGKLDATREEIERASREAFADDFIRKLPDGYATVIGDRGQKLSGGERQRLSIARAFLRDSPILILDEATSALDNTSEKAVQAALEKLMKDRTTIVIAHRLSTIRNVDRIYVLREGEVTEQGSHEELLARSGEYAAFLRIAEAGSGRMT
jgi:subfamily B ATP-binding cassette protein MsbA